MFFALGFIAGIIVAFGAIALSSRHDIQTKLTTAPLPWEKAVILRSEEVQDINALSQLNDTDENLTIDDIYGTDRR